METASKELKCRDIIAKMIPEAKKEASKEFKNFAKQVEIKLRFSPNDEATFLRNLLTVECENYDTIKNIEDLKKFKSDLLKFFVNSIDIYDKEMNFNQEGYDAQKHAIMRQFLALYKIDFLKKNMKRIADSEYPPIDKEKIKWIGRPSEFGILINELISKGYIEPPIPLKGDKSKYKKQLTKLCHSAFRIPNLEGNGETSEDNLYEEIKKPSLSDPDTAFFKISRFNHNRK
jgi:hypothetical protein